MLACISVGWDHAMKEAARNVMRADQEADRFVTRLINAALIKKDYLLQFSSLQERKRRSSTQILPKSTVAQCRADLPVMVIY